MARAVTNKLYRTFVKGLVTEASPLTYPEDASYNELNTVLSRKGSRTRRLGQTYTFDQVDLELGSVVDGSSQSEYVWTSVGKNPNLNFLVVQKGITLTFYDLAETTAVGRRKGFTVTLTRYKRPGATSTDVAMNQFQMASGKGLLYVVGRDIEPIYIEYDKTLDGIKVYKIKILMRDFDGLNDELANDQEPTTLSKEHHYNLMNQGWVYGSTSNTTSPVSMSGYTFGGFQYNLSFAQLSEAYGQILSGDVPELFHAGSYQNSPIYKFYHELSRYPGNNKQWWAARAQADDDEKNIKEGDFLPKVLDKLYSGNNRAPRGHFILDAFYKDRTKVSGISDITVDSTPYRPEAIAFFSGRAWYGAGSMVYFSQILDTEGGAKSGLCYQEADPTAEDISDLIASDGGVIPIPEADRIIRLMPLAGGVVVFAENGVWFVSGGDAAFTATALSVEKVSSIGTKATYAAIEVGEKIFWWSEVGIQALEQSQGAFGPIPGKFGNTNISEQTIQTLYNEIPSTSKKFAKAIYDDYGNTVMWLYRDSDALTGDYEYNKCILFDLTLQAFFLWEFSYITGGPVINGFYNSIRTTESLDETEVVSNGETVLDTSLAGVVVEGASISYSPNRIEYIIDVPGAGTGWSSTTDTSCVDWSSFDGTGATYESFVETGYELMNDTMRKKQAVFLHAHFRQMDGSSCTLTTKWDWATNVNSNRWSSPVEVYRERNRPTDSLADLQGFEVVTTRNKVRGSGRALQFKFGTSEANVNFDLLGWSVAYSGNTSP